MHTSSFALATGPLLWRATQKLILNKAKSEVSTTFCMATYKLNFYTFVCLHAKQLLNAGHFIGWFHHTSFSLRGKVSGRNATSAPRALRLRQCPQGGLTVHALLLVLRPLFCSIGFRHKDNTASSFFHEVIITYIYEIHAIGSIIRWISYENIRTCCKNHGNLNLLWVPFT